MTLLVSAGSNAAERGRPVGPVKLVVPSRAWQAQQFEAVQLMTQAWESLGVKSTYITVPGFPAFLTTVASGDWDALTSAYIANPQRIDPQQLLSFPLMCDFAGPNKTNSGSYCNPKYDQFVRESGATWDDNRRRQLVFEAQALLARDLPLIAQYHPNEIDIYNKQRLSDVVKSPMGGLVNQWNFLQAVPQGADKAIKLADSSRGLPMNPFKTTAYHTTLEYQNLIYDTLAKVAVDGSVVPWAAKSWRIDGNVVRVSLRDDQQFTDGRALTSKDVKYTFEAIKEFQVPFYAPNLAPIKSIEAIDPHNFNLHLNHPYSPLFTLVFAGIPILPEHIWSAAMKEKGLKSPGDWQEPDMTGSGPFILESYDPAQQLIMRRNPKHFSAPKAERVIIQVFQQQEAAYLSVQQRVHDILSPNVVNPNFIERSKSAPHLAVLSGPGITVRYMAFNMREGSPFRDHALRTALAHAIDYKTVVGDILKDTAVPGSGIISPANTAWHNPKVTYPQFDLGKAREILRNAGYRWDDRGQLLYPENYSPKVLAD
jgi:peptide/nickel transport system substrate-binding protein